MYAGGSRGRVPTFLTSGQDILSLYDDPPNTPKSLKWPVCRFLTKFLYAPPVFLTSYHLIFYDW